MTSIATAVSTLILTQTFAFLLANPAHAQSTAPGSTEATQPWQGPGLRTRPPPLDPAEPDSENGNEPIRVLPPLETLSPLPDPSKEAPSAQTPPGAIHFTLREIDFSGNTVFSNAELNKVVSSYLDRDISTVELLQLRNDVTAYYVSRGYVSSGARVPDQDPNGGRLRIEIIEGKLDEIEFATPTRLSPRYIERRLRLGGDRPLQVDRLERRLRNLQESSPILRVDVRIEPGPHPGRDRMVLAVEEAPIPFVWAEAGTLVSPNLGGWAGRAGFQLDSPFGWGERARTQFTFAEGIIDLEGGVSIPLWAYDTRLTLSGRYAETRVVSDPLDDADIETTFASLGFELLQPVWRTGRARLDLGVIGEWRRGLTFLDNERIGFSEGSDGGELRVAALRFFAAGRVQSPQQVIGFRSTWSIGLGIDALKATKQDNGLEDARFHAWLGQIQLLRSLSDWPIDILLRGEVQLADDRLLPIERFSIGGRYSVRGYRENVFVRDNGAAGSIELRWQAVRAIDRRRIVELFAFFDGGRSWERTDRPGDRADSLAALGLGVRYSPKRWFDLELSFARRLVDRPSVIQEDVQDDGLFLRVQLAAR